MAHGQRPSRTGKTGWRRGSARAQETQNKPATAVWPFGALRQPQRIRKKAVRDHAVSQRGSHRRTRSEARRTPRPVGTRFATPSVCLNWQSARGNELKCERGEDRSTAPAQLSVGDLQHCTLELVFEVLGRHLSEWTLRCGTSRGAASDGHEAQRWPLMRRQGEEVGLHTGHSCRPNVLRHCRRNE